MWFAVLAQVATLAFWFGSGFGTRTVHFMVRLMEEKYKGRYAGCIVVYEEGEYSTSSCWGLEERRTTYERDMVLSPGDYDVVFQIMDDDRILWKSPAHPLHLEGR